MVKLRRGIARHLKQPHRFLLMTERERSIDENLGDIERHAIKDPELLGYKGCFARLRMFDPGWQQNRKLDDRLVCLDLDMVITGLLDPIFDRPDTFCILAGANSHNPCPFNGSVMMLRPGNHEELWTRFSYQAACELPFYEFPDDQGWIAHKLPTAGRWEAGKRSGIWAFQKPPWRHFQTDLPANARIVAFPGARQVKDYRHLPWVKEHWK